MDTDKSFFAERPSTHTDMSANDSNTTPDNAAHGGCRDATCSPVRVVLSRRKGWRMPENTVKVCRPGKWGNPFHVADILDHYDGDKIAAQADCVRSFRRWITDENSWCGDPPPPSLEEIRAELSGKNLACWCKEGTPCHADVLLDLANVQSEP